MGLCLVNLGSNKGTRVFGEGQRDERKGEEGRSHEIAGVDRAWGQGPAFGDGSEVGARGGFEAM